MNRPPPLPLPPPGRKAGEPLTALPVQDAEPLTALPMERPALPPVVSLADEPPRIPPPPPPGPILDALPVAERQARVPPPPPPPPRRLPPPLPALALNALPVTDPLTLGGLVRLVWRWVAGAVEWAFGVATLIVGLAFLAAIPVVGFLSLGYLLEAGGRIARNTAQRDALVRRRARLWITRFFLSGWLALNDGIIGVRKAARIGGLVLGVGLVVLPLQLVSSLYASAQIIDPGGPAARGWHTALTWLMAFAGVHITLACLHGGKIRHFLWPIGNLVWLVRRVPDGRFYTEPRDAVWEFVVSLRLPYYFWLGARGYIGGLAWLVVPITMMALGRQAPLVGLMGAGLFGMLLFVLPFLQMRFAVENRFKAAFELGPVLMSFIRAPWAFALAQLVALLFSVPLYLFKIEFIQREVGGMPTFFFVLVSLVFVVFIYPTRLLAGWAYARSERRQAPRHWIFSTTALLAMVPWTAAYVGFVFLTQYVSWKGFASLYEQHTFLLPVPF